MAKGLKLDLLKVFLLGFFYVLFVSRGYCEDMAQCLQKSKKEDCECRVKCDTKQEECLKNLNSPKPESSEFRSCNQLSMACWLKCLGDNKQALKDSPVGMVTKAISNPKIFKEKLNLPPKGSVSRCASLVKEVEDLYDMGQRKKCELPENENVCEELASQLMIKGADMNSCINANYPR
ncbi:MAG: hypothetical protein JNN05_02395 [Candidatus Omnitrophica bacterium]|nr:hypothetical protein [Candidatus Omnitrophota bacterium]